MGLIIRKRAVPEFPIQHELDGPKLSVRCLGARGQCVLSRAQRGIVALLLSLFVAPLCAAQTYGNSAPPATNATRSGVGEEEGRIIYVNGGAKLVHPGGAKLVHLTLCGTRCWGVVPVVHRRDPRCFV